MAQVDILDNFTPVPAFTVLRRNKMKRGSSVSGPVTSPPVMRTSGAVHVDAKYAALPDVASLDAFLSKNDVDC